MNNPHEVSCRDVSCHDVSCHGQRLRKRGTDGQGADVRRLADVAYPIDNPAGAMSSGYFRTIGMVVAPYSMRSLGKITHGIISNMLARAADVQ